MSLTFTNLAFFQSTMTFRNSNISEGFSSTLILLAGGCEEVHGKGLLGEEEGVVLGATSVRAGVDPGAEDTGEV